MGISPQHYQELIDSALTIDDITALKIFSSAAPTSKRLTGYSVEGMLIPYFDPWGVPYVGYKGSDFHRIKPQPGSFLPKYLTPKGTGNRPYFPQNFNWPEFIKSKSKQPIVITEGEKTAAAICAAGYPAIGLPGVTSWKDKSDRLENPSDVPAQMAEDEPLDTEPLDESRPLPELVELLEILGPDRQFIILFDSDLTKNYMVQQSALRLAEWLLSNSCKPMLCLLPAEPDGSKNGADDLIARHGKSAIDLIIKNAWFAIKKDGDGNKLNIPSEKDLKHKAILAQAAFMQNWAYRAGYGWYHWDGKKWLQLDDGQGTYIDKALYDLSDANGWRTQTNGVLSGLYRHMKAQLLAPDHLWNQTRFMPFQNGVLEIATGQFRPHSPTDWNTQVLSYEYNPTATAPTWLGFINQALGNDPAAVALVQAFFRWALTPKGTGKLKLEVCWDLFGKPGTGKGTTLETLRNLVGRENAGTFKTAGLTNPNYLAHLKDKLCSISSDDSGHLDDVGLFGELISNEPVGVKLLYQNIKFTSLNTFFIRAYNDFVTTTGNNNSALDRRIVAMSFDHQPKVRDVDLQEKLNAELAGVFNWAWSITEAEMISRIKNAANVAAVAKASAERFEANNPVYSFLVEEYPKGIERILPRELYKRYSEWSRETGRIALNQRQFSTKIQSFGCSQTGKIGGYKYWVIPCMDNYSVIDNLGISQKSKTDGSYLIEIDGESNPPEQSQPRIEHDTRKGYPPTLRVFTYQQFVNPWTDFLRKSGFNVVLSEAVGHLWKILAAEVNEDTLAAIKNQNPNFAPVS